MIEEVEALNLGLSFNLPKIEDGVHTDSSIFFSNDLAFPFTSYARKIPNNQNIPANKILHTSVQQRWQTCPWYRPKPLELFTSQLGESRNLKLAEPLAVGQTAPFVVIAQKPENHTSIQIEEGGTYTISVRPTQVWQDDQISCTAAGWKITKVGDDNDWVIQAIETQEISAVLGKFYQISKNLSQLAEAEWMELLVRIEDKRYRVGPDLSVEFTSVTSGELIACANDAPGFYQNNQGWIFATITRTD
jgi:hypothetical protein